MSIRLSISRGVCFLVVLAAVCPTGCSNEAAASKKATGKKGGESVPVLTATVVTRDVPLEIQVIGNVEAFSTVSVKARVTGVIDKVHFHEGAFVAKGDKLFTIDPAPFLTALSQAEANLAKERALLQQARANLSRDLAQQRLLVAQASRFANLNKEGVISRDEAEQRQASADVVEQSVAAGEAAIKGSEASIQAAEAAVKTARIMLGYTSVASPVEGRTGNLAAKEGNLATANVTELIAISQVQPAYVSFAVPESQLGLVKDGMARGKLPVSAAPPDDPANPESGILTFIDSSVDPSTGTIRLKGTFANSKRRLWPGQFVRVTLRFGVKSGALLVPNQAVQTGQDGPYVYRVKPDHSVEMVKVAAAGRIEQDIIIQDGLGEGDTVVTEGQLRLAPGMRIRVREEGGQRKRGQQKKEE